ncbi:MAG: YcfL family protein, partial [Limisphaerales bacterium]
GVISLLAVGCAHKPCNENGQVVFLDARVENSIEIAGVEQSTTPDGRLHVIANLRNRTNDRLEMQVNCVFKDEHGFSTGDETPWQTLIMTENAQESVSFVAMNAQGKRATIRVRQPR